MVDIINVLLAASDLPNRTDTQHRGFLVSMVLVCTTIKTDNHHLTQEMRRPRFSLLRRGRCQITSRLIQHILRHRSCAMDLVGELLQT